MQALQRRAGGSTTFVQFNGKTGKIVLKTKGEGGQTLSESFDTIAGTITDIKRKDDEFEGKPVVKLAVQLVNGTERYQLEVNAGTRAAMEFMARLNNAEVGQPTLIQGYVLEKGSEMQYGDGTTGIRDNDYVGISVRQGPDFGTKVAPNYGPEFGEKAPKAITFEKLNHKTKEMETVVDKEATAERNLELTQELAGEFVHRIQESKGENNSESDGLSGDEVQEAAGRPRAAA